MLHVGPGRDASPRADHDSGVALWEPHPIDPAVVTEEVIREAVSHLGESEYRGEFEVWNTRLVTESLRVGVGEAKVEQLQRQLELLHSLFGATTVHAGLR